METWSELTLPNPREVEVVVVKLSLKVILASLETFLPLLKKRILRNYSMSMITLRLDWLQARALPLLALRRCHKQARPWKR